MSESKGPVLIGLAGPKGGVGKSFTAANLAVALSDKGVTTLLADLDLGGANLQAIMGLSGRRPNLGDFMYNKIELKKIIRQTELPGLDFLPGSTDALGVANMLQWQKVKLLNQLHKTGHQAVIADLGAGSAYNTLDIFAACDIKLLVTTPEMPSVLNTYGFIKSLVFRLFLRRLKSEKRMRAYDIVTEAISPPPEQPQPSILGLIDRVGQPEPEDAQCLREVLTDLDIRLVLSMSQDKGDEKAAQALVKLSQKRLDLNLTVAGITPFDREARQSVVRMKPLLKDGATSPAGLAVAGLAESIYGESLSG